MIRVSKSGKATVEQTVVSEDRNINPKMQDFESHRDSSRGVCHLSKVI